MSSEASIWKFLDSILVPFRDKYQQDLSQIRTEMKRKIDDEFLTNPLLVRSLFALAREENANLEDTSRYFPVQESIRKVVQFFNELLHLDL